VTRSWTITDLEFFVICEELGAGIPEPMTFRSRTPLWEDFVREKKEVRARLSTPGNAEFLMAFGTLLRPQVRVVVEGWDDRDPENPDGYLRMVGARCAGFGYLASQLPGETFAHSGGFTVVEFDAAELPDRVVAGMPAAAAGSQPDLALVTLHAGAEKDRFISDAVLGASFEQGARSAAFLRSATTCKGRIDVIQGHSVFGPRGITRHRLNWRDHLGDGRYVVRPGHPPTAGPVTGPQLRGLIADNIGKVLQTLADEES
jgi:hypothetical protein